MADNVPMGNMLLVLRLIRNIIFVGTAALMAQFALGLFDGEGVLWVNLIVSLVLMVFSAFFSAAIRNIEKLDGNEIQFQTKIDEKVGIDPDDEDKFEKYQDRTNKFLKIGTNGDKVVDIIVGSKSQEEFNESMEEIGYFEFMLNEAKKDEEDK